MIDRRSGLGGTDVAAILGLDPRRSAFDVYMDKRGEMPPAPPSDRMWAGKRLERAIAEMYGERTGRAITWSDQTKRARARSWQLWTPDFFAWEPGTVTATIGGDAKNVAWDQQWRWGEEGTDQVPDWIATQCHWYLSASGCIRWDVAALFGGNDFRIYSILPDTEVEGIILQEAEKFWRDSILGGKQPDIKATEGAERYLRAKYPDNSGILRVPAGEEAALLEEYRLARKEAAAACAERDDLEARVKLAIGEDDGFKFGENRVTYRKINGRRRIDCRPEGEW